MVRLRWRRSSWQSGSRPMRRGCRKNTPPARRPHSSIWPPRAPSTRVGCVLPLRAAAPTAGPPGSPLPATRSSGHAWRSLFLYFFILLFFPATHGRASRRQLIAALFSPSARHVQSGHCRRSGCLAVTPVGGGVRRTSLVTELTGEHAFAGAFLLNSAGMLRVVETT